jgi:diphthamide biosynthesis enzyme Dph1/Dph2-like protein
MDNKLQFLNLPKFVNYLKVNQQFKKIALQISDELLDLSISLTKTLLKEFPDIFFFSVAETSYGQCCADEVAAQHLKADLILRVGQSCLTQTLNLPVYFINIQKKGEVDLFLGSLNSIREKFPKNDLIIIYEDEFEDFLSQIKVDERLFISAIPVHQDLFKNHSINMKLYSKLKFIDDRIIIGKNKVDENDCLVFFGSSDSKLFIEICLKFLNTNKVAIFNLDNLY